MKQSEFYELLFKVLSDFDLPSECQKDLNVLARQANHLGTRAIQLDLNNVKVLVKLYYHSCDRTKNLEFLRPDVTASIDSCYAIIKPESMMNYANSGCLASNIMSVIKATFSSVLVEVHRPPEPSRIPKKKIKNQMQIISQLNKWIKTKTNYMRVGTNKSFGKKTGVKLNPYSITKNKKEYEVRVFPTWVDILRTK